jgi:hypothetical protein
MAVNDQDQQAAFIDMLREGYVLTTEQIVGIFRVRNAYKYVQQVIKRTGLEIYQGKMMRDDGAEDVFYMTSDISPSEPGLDHMEEAEVVVDSIETIVTNTVESQKGYYLMWSCPATFGSGLCEQFHKVDLGDEQFTEPRSVRCIKCGKQYLVKPIPEN